MKGTPILGFIGRAIGTGALIVAPVYFAGLLVIEIAQALGGVVRPLTALVPASLPAERVLSLLVVVAIFFLIGAAVFTPQGRALGDRIEKALQRIPAYAMLRGLTQQLAHTGDDQSVWKPALVEMEDALAPAFIIEAVEGGKFTVFVPSSPTPIAGTIYILPKERVHPLDVPFTQAVKAISQWGSGSKKLVAALNAQARAAASSATTGPGP